MDIQSIQRQYDQVIAPHYDLDPQAVNDRALDRAIHQLRKLQLLSANMSPARVLDVGVGTGKLLAKLKEIGGQQIQPFGLDLSEKMVETACKKMPDLVAEVDDAAHLDAHFGDQKFDLICTHFITGYVPMELLAPKIWSRLSPGGYWSFVGGTQAGFPALQSMSRRKWLRYAFGGRTFSVGEITCNPADHDDVIGKLTNNGFSICSSETFEPDLEFEDLEDFMNFGYRGGWLTPFIETLGLHKAGWLTRTLLGVLVFPIKDHHSIEIVLAQKKDS